VKYPPKLYTFLEVRLELHHGYDKCNNIWVSPRVLQKKSHENPLSCCNHKTHEQKIHKPKKFTSLLELLSEVGGGDFCTMERLCLSSHGWIYLWKSKTAEDFSSHKCQKIKTIKSLWTSQKRMKGKMQAGFLSCILCSLLILLQSLYDKLLVDKGSKAIVVHFALFW
jgi:hypothetical protein